jgi:UDP-2,3-diacylglucosamine pyrophosphatase LpxH
MTTRPPPRRYRALFLSDIHLGRRDARVDRVRDFLMRHDADLIYLVGDIIEGWQPCPRWARRARHRAILVELARRARRGTRVIYLPGNHDNFVRSYCGTRRAGMELRVNAIHEAADGRRYLVTHGDEFDAVGSRLGGLAAISKHAYFAVLAISKLIDHAKSALGFSRSLQRLVAERVASGNADFFKQAITHAARLHGVDGVIYGHFHTPGVRSFDGFDFVNCGDWLESCTALAERSDGRLEIIDWSDPDEEVLRAEELQPLHAPAAAPDGELGSFFQAGSG